MGGKWGTGQARCTPAPGSESDHDRGTHLSSRTYNHGPLVVQSILEAPPRHLPIARPQHEIAQHGGHEDGSGRQADGPDAGEQLAPRRGVVEPGSGHREQTVGLGEADEERLSFQQCGR